MQPIDTGGGRLVDAPSFKELNDRAQAQQQLPDPIPIETVLRTLNSMSSDNLNKVRNMLYILEVTALSNNSRLLEPAWYAWSHDP